MLLLFFALYPVWIVIAHFLFSAQCHSVFHKTAPPIFASAVKSLGENYVKSSLDEIFTHVDTEALDRVAPQVFSKASASFMDQALESRLDTISGRQLVNALAKAERLGYSAEDIVVESSGASKSERVIPAIKDISSSLVAAQPQTAPSPQPAQAPTMAWPVSPESITQLGIVFCHSCGRPCSGKVALAAVGVFTSLHLLLY